MKEFAVPLGVAVAIGAAVASFVTPRWNAAGFPYFLGQGKNVEHAAVAAALIAGVASAFMLRSKSGRVLATMVALTGFAVLALRADPRALLAAGPELLFVLALCTALGLRREPSGAALGTGKAWLRTDVPIVFAAIVLGGLIGVAFVLSLRPLVIDAFHHGEVLASAVDLLGGGRPFESFLWPHGFHDTGLTALWILITEKVGTSPVALAQATCRALGVVTIFALAFRLLGSRVAGLAACVPLVFAVALEESGRRGAAFTLEQLGTLVFVALGFVALMSPRPRAEIPAGALFGLAFVFRIEAGVYGALAAMGVLAWSELVDRGTVVTRSLRLFAASLGRLLLGIALPLVLLRLLVGWPGLAWFAYTLHDLPTYHRDAAGTPFPWPLGGTTLPDVSGLVAVGLGRLVLVLLLLVLALAGERHPPRGGPGRAGAPIRPLLFVALFAALAVRSALDRVDEYHLLQWGALPVLCVAVLVVAGLRDRWAWSPWPTALVLGAALGILDLNRLTLTLPDPAVFDRLAQTPQRRWTFFLEHVRPNPPVGECADRFFTPTEAGRDRNRRFIAATCAVERQLLAHQVKNLVITHSAPWYYVRFGLPLPTRYFALARAYTPAQQRELVGDLRARRPEALLQVRGFDGLRRFDIPDAVRVPIVEAYLRERRRGVAPQATALGDLYFWNDPPAAPPSASSPSNPVVAPTVTITVERATYQPMTGLLFAEGWASDASGPPPRALTSVNAPKVESFEYGISRPDLATACGFEGWSPCGFEYAALLDPQETKVLLERRVVEVQAVLADGRTSRSEMPLAGLSVLGDLTGPEWSDFAREVRDAAAKGVADREASMRRETAAR